MNSTAGSPVSSVNSCHTLQQTTGTTRGNSTSSQPDVGTRMDTKKKGRKKKARKSAMKSSTGFTTNSSGIQLPLPRPKRQKPDLKPQPGTKISQNPSPPAPKPPPVDQPVVFGVSTPNQARHDELRGKFRRLCVFTCNTKDAIAALYLLNKARIAHVEAQIATTCTNAKLGQYCNVYSASLQRAALLHYCNVQLTLRQLKKRLNHESAKQPVLADPPPKGLPEPAQFEGPVVTDKQVTVIEETHKLWSELHQKLSCNFNQPEGPAVTNKQGNFNQPEGPTVTDKQVTIQGRHGEEPNPLQVVWNTFIEFCQGSTGYEHRCYLKLVRQLSKMSEEDRIPYTEGLPEVFSTTDEVRNSIHDNCMEGCWFGARSRRKRRRRALSAVKRMRYCIECRDDVVNKIGKDRLSVPDRITRVTVHDAIIKWYRENNWRTDDIKSISGLTLCAVFTHVEDEVEQFAAWNQEWYSTYGMLHNMPGASLTR